MAERSPQTKLHIDKDGVRTIEGPGVRTSVWLLALAMVLVGIAVIVLLRPLIYQSQTLATEPSSSGITANLQAPRLTPALPQARPRAAGAPVDVPRTPDRTAPSQPQQPGLRPQSEPVSETAPAAPPENEANESADQPSGIAVFPPPGTKPIKRGIIVPENFELPPGYVRHYQTTDDGRQLPPILMFHPDYQPLDDRGEPIPLPEDRVVPLELAPTDMPVQTLDDPDNATPQAGGRARGSNEPGR